MERAQRPDKLGSVRRQRTTTEKLCGRKRVIMQQLTVYVVDLQPGQVFGCPVLRGREECWVVDWKVSVVILQNGQSSPLDTARDERQMERKNSNTAKYYLHYG